MGAIIAGEYGSSYSVGQLLLSTLTKSGSTNNLSLTSLSIVGLTLILLGSFLRVQCYRAMAFQFTADISIQKNHKLITTGPYSFVRHPSYSGIILVYVGMIFWFGTRGSLLMESGVLETALGLTFFGVYSLGLSALLAMGVSRMDREDQELRMVFGEEWDRWAHKVSYKLIPGLF